MMKTVLAPPEITTTTDLSQLSAVYVRQFPLFAKLPPLLQEQLSRLLRMDCLPAGQVIFHYNDLGTAMYFVASGKIRIVTRGHNGAEMVLEEVGTGDIFGEVALYSGGQRTAAAIAAEESIVLVLHKHQLNEFLGVCPEVSEYLLRRMATRLVSSNRLLRRASLSVDEAVDASRSQEDRVVKRLVETIATVPVLNAHLIFIVLWVAARVVLGNAFVLETENFEKISFVLGAEALIVSLLVLINQNREAKEESVRDHTEYEATLHADQAINYLHEKVDALSAEIRNLNSACEPAPEIVLKKGDRMNDWDGESFSTSR